MVTTNMYHDHPKYFNDYHCVVIFRIGNHYHTCTQVWWLDVIAKDKAYIQI